MLNQSHGTIKIFAGNASKKLAQAICEHLDLKLGKMEVGRFSDGETSVNIQESVRGCDVFVVQSTNTPVNENLMDLLVIVDALKRASAGRITVVCPYFGYARQDRKARARDPISAKLVADLLQTAGATRLLTMDLHSSQVQGFFNIPVDNLMGMPILAKHFAKQGFRENPNLTVVSPDVGSVSRSRALASRFDAPLAIIDKRRPRANVMEVMNVIGDIKGKTCLMIDDMVDT
ncbi:MAG: ribose-phosphate pyrophosphokinase, partial [Clostridia bacterium]|nr:ribose-phosphate pyrophosphokinase [Clostridia bacterium]